MKSKLLNLTSVITSLFGYLEWGNDNSMFLFQAEYDIVIKLFTDLRSVLHPFILLPLFGQLLLVLTLFQKTPGKLVTYTGIACIGLLLGLMFVIGIIEMNIKILASTLPFVITAVIVVLNFKKRV